MLFADGFRPTWDGVTGTSTGPLGRARSVSMSAAHDNRTLLIAFAANLGIAVSKFAAAAVTGSSAMLTEGIHSVVIR